MVWALHRQWWQLRIVRRLLWLVPTVVFSLVLLWTGATLLDLHLLERIAYHLAALCVIVSLALVVALPFSGTSLLLERAVRWVVQRWRRPPEAPKALDHDRSRRQFVTSSAAVFPAITLGAAISGTATSFSDVRFPHVDLTFANLPAGLDGLRILHISDIHLGYITLSDVEQLVRAAAEHPVDLIVVTGDLADDVRLLPEALRMIGSLPARHGTFASVGNHEYYADFSTATRALDRGPIPLLLDSGVSLQINGARLYLAGADDPASTRKRPLGADANLSRHERKHLFLAHSIDTAFDGAPSDAFYLLMSHRPEALDPASERGIDLTLAGHTHGGLQMGWGGRSLFEAFAPENYLWGHYRRNGSQLYTSAGVGHWFPYRFNCPPEAPIYTLRRGSA